MGTSVFGRLWTSCLLVLGTAFAVSVVAAPPASAKQAALNAWQDFYGATSASGDTADCLLCHSGDPRTDQDTLWNAYGFEVRDALRMTDPPELGGCDLSGNGQVDFDEAFLCVEDLDSDLDPGANDNFVEIDASTQPGWTDGPNNTVYSQTSSTDNNLPPAGIGQYDPDGGGGTGGTGGMGGMGGMGGDDRIPPGQYKRRTHVVRPGQSIQEALDRAEEGARIYVLAGVYKEHGNTTNGLNITKNGIRLIGQNRSDNNKNKDKDKDKERGVIIRNTSIGNANGQRNGIVIAPPMVTDCMSCHEDMAPPFPLLPGVEPGLPDPTPLLYDIEVKNVRIEDFRNNGLFLERVSDYVIDNVESIRNAGYGIFPVLTQNGVITNSYAKGSHDSGIWIETSENVVASNNLVEENVNGFEVSNSDNILLIDNESRFNTVGAAILLLPDIFDDRPGATHIDMVNNWLHDNNKPNTAPPGSILSELPAGIGILYLGVDDSVISGNLIENNEYTGIAIADYCAVVTGIPDPRFWCGIDPDTLTPGFLEDQSADDNRVEGNTLVNNAGSPPPPPFGDFAAAHSLLTLPASWIGLPGGDERPYHGNCYENNQNSSEPWVLEFFSLYDATVWQMGGPPPPWDLPACE